MSWSELVLRVISGSNDSTPGPDGIPFADTGLSLRFTPRFYSR
jgi:hypothetical protein